jgi:hypothetical protein
MPDVCQDSRLLFPAMTWLAASDGTRALFKTDGDNIKKYFLQNA